MIARCLLAVAPVAFLSFLFTVSKTETRAGSFRATPGEQGYTVVGAATPEPENAGPLSWASRIFVDVTSTKTSWGLGLKGGKRTPSILWFPVATTFGVSVRAYGTIRGQTVSNLPSDSLLNDQAMANAYVALAQAAGRPLPDKPVDKMSELRDALQAVAGSIVADGPPYLADAAPLVAQGGGQVRTTDPTAFAAWLIAMSAIALAALAGALLAARTGSRMISRTPLLGSPLDTDLHSK